MGDDLRKEKRNPPSATLMGTERKTSTKEKNPIVREGRQQDCVRIKGHKDGVGGKKIRNDLSTYAKKSSPRTGENKGC